MIVKQDGLAAVANGGHDQLRYEAFVSYRRAQGSQIATWLSERLERYRPSKKVLAKLPPDVARRLGEPRRIFLDRRFERSSSDFWHRQIVPALVSARRLVVVSTPDAFKPRSDGTDN